MSAILAALVPVVVQAVLDLASGAKPEDVLPKLQAAAVAYSLALADWEKAKTDNPV